MSVFVRLHAHVRIYRRVWVPQHVGTFRHIRPACANATRTHTHAHTHTYAHAFTHPHPHTHTHTIGEKFILDLSRVGFTGVIPEALSNVTKLQVLQTNLRSILQPKIYVHSRTCLPTYDNLILHVLPTLVPCPCARSSVLVVTLSPASSQHLSPNSHPTSKYCRSNTPTPCTVLCLWK